MSARNKSRLYGFGSNGSGQLGIGHQNDTSKPETCMFWTLMRHDPYIISTYQSCDEVEGTIKKIVAGGNHTLVLMEDGRVWAAGDNSDGRCGYRFSMEHSDVFRIVDGISSGCSVSNVDVTDVAATWTASFFVINGRKIMSCGSGLRGEMGLGPHIETVHEPVVHVMFDAGEGKQIAKISASMGHVVILTSSGEAYGWGACRKGQLGKDFILEKVLCKPRLLTLPFMARDVACGRDFTFFIGHNGDHVLFGELKGYDRLDFSKIDPTVAVYASWSSLFLKGDGSLVATGRSDRGQTSVDDLPKLKSIAVGSEHCVALTCDQQILAWGWGEHGNCGKPRDEDGDVESHHNTVYLDLTAPALVSVVGAGCATSFVVAESDG